MTKAFWILPSTDSSREFLVHIRLSNIGQPLGQEFLGRLLQFAQKLRNFLGPYRQCRSGRVLGILGLCLRGIQRVQCLDALRFVFLLTSLK